MLCRFNDFCEKDVISISDGSKIGRVDDLEIDTECARVRCFIIYGRRRFFGVFGREDDIYIPWDNVQVFGEDTILVSVKHCQEKKHHKKRQLFKGLFE
jgi:sporulation protein, YlmC/YmxH family